MRVVPPIRRLIDPCNKIGTPRTSSAMQRSRQPYGGYVDPGASGSGLVSHFSLELVDSTRPQPGHARHPADSEPLGEFVLCLGSAPGRPRRPRMMPPLVVKGI